MPVIQLIVILAIIGFLLYAVNRWIPMQATIKTILNWVVIVATVIWLLGVFGLFHYLGNVRIGHWS